MFPNSPNLGRPPFPPPRNDFFSKFPAGLPPALLSPQQLIEAQLNLRNARALLNGNFATIPTASPQPWSYGNGSPVPSPAAAPSTFQGRKRRSDEQNVPYDVKRQRFYSPPLRSALVHQTVPLQDERRYSVPGSIVLPLIHMPNAPDVNGCVLPLKHSPFLDHIETTLPVARDKLSQQVLELFQSCQQQACDLKKKNACRAELQREIQQLFPLSRLYLVGSSLNGFGTRSSDADLCLVVQEEPVNQKTEARHILSLVQKHFSTRLSYIERPQLIRAKVPIVKFRDKVSGVEFDLNVNNVVGIRNTFLLRTYAHTENRVRPLVLVVKKWASHCGINDASRGTLSSYSLVLMVLHYLQTLPEPILPSLQKMYPEHFNPTMQLDLVHQAPCTIPPYLSKNGSTLGDLFVGFLKYYATEFDWSKMMISVREAKAVPRPDDIEWRHKFICVEEPFDRTNTARAVHEKYKFDKIQDEFLKSWHKLKDKRDLNSMLPYKNNYQYTEKMRG
ncbi:poly(A) RNA polymerase GLD2 isoform X1 [Rhinatrema bivittatum]|uniref:poly(A) RNA polymerase GLD2 isoform X1 n=1 Tax=Rhinatrema bivittatum TaxID=194408 RepID=UPI001128AF0C|nr:poly(A) RNA polymerase GLD2 isoform X1 [Rhinatrema bivittatum]